MYSFTATARNSVNSSTPSTAISATTQGAAATPQATLTVGNADTASAVSAVASTASSGGVDVSWSGSGTGYVVQFRKSSVGTWSVPSGTCALDSTKISAANTGIVTGLEPGQRYTFQVAPYVNGGPGTFSSSTLSSNILALGVPLAPRIGTPTATGTTTATVAFNTPTYNGGSTISGYTATSNPGGFTGTVSKAGAGTITVNGLTPGTSYTFTVTATNTYGTSVASSPSSPVATFGRPTAPGIGTATATNRTTATVAFTAPTDTGGSPITEYVVTSNPVGGTSSTRTTAGTFTVTGLTPGTSYTFTVTAKNTYGTSLPSDPSASVTPRTSYIVGEVGPGSGKVFYASTTGFTCGPTLASMCHHMEVGAKSAATVMWCSNTKTLVAGTFGTAVGTGYRNTQNMENSTTACATGAWVSATAASGGLSDWYLPSQVELAQLQTQRAAVGRSGDTNSYWSSSQVFSDSARYHQFSQSTGYEGNKTNPRYVLPGRAF